METSPWVLTDQGIHRLDGSPVPTPFSGRSVVAGTRRGSAAAVVVEEREVWVSDGRKWCKWTTAPCRLRCLQFLDDTDLLVGTKGARLARVCDGGFEFLESFDRVSNRSRWTTPWGGPPDVRSIAASVDGALYVDIHVGWIVRSIDGGESWAPLEGLHPDVHRVTAHPHRPEVVLAATAGGFYWSDDHGDTFAVRNQGLPYVYQRDCAVFPDRDVYLVSTSRGPHGEVGARLYRSEDEGVHWTEVQGLPFPLSANIDTFQIAVRHGGVAWVVVENCEVYRSDDYGTTFQQTDVEYPLIHALVA